MKQCSWAWSVDAGEHAVGDSRAGGQVRTRGDGHARAQHDLAELALAGGLDPHGADGLVLVADDDDARGGGEVQEPEHVALRERADQQLLGVVPRRVAAERRVGRAQQGRLRADPDLVVVAVRRCSSRCRLAAGAGPGDVDGVRVEGAHPPTVAASGGACAVRGVGGAT